MVKPTLILFDIDGTLLKSDGAGKAAFEAALADTFGLEAATEGIVFAGSTDWDILERVLIPRGYSSDAVAIAVGRFAESLVYHLERVIDQFFVEALPGTLELVNALVKDPRARLGLVTGNVARTAPIKLRRAGFDPAVFPVGAYGDDAADRNALPPLALQRAAAHYGMMFAGERVVLVGDTPSDIVCARSVQGRAVAVLTGWDSREELMAEAPYAILDDLSDRALVESVLFGEG